MGSGARVYGYINIDTSSPGSAESALIHIRVPVTWYEQNTLDPATTTVTHCGDESIEWEVLEVVSSSEDEGYYYFTVRTPGFSEFSVAALPLETDDVSVKGDEVESEVQMGDEEEDRTSGSILLIPVVAVILAVVFLVFWRYRKGKDEEMK